MYVDFLSLSRKLRSRDRNQRSLPPNFRPHSNQMPRCNLLFLVLQRRRPVHLFRVSISPLGVTDGRRIPTEMSVRTTTSRPSTLQLGSSIKPRVYVWPLSLSTPSFL